MMERRWQAILFLFHCLLMLLLFRLFMLYNCLLCSLLNVFCFYQIALHLFLYHRRWFMVQWIFLWFLMIWWLMDYLVWLLLIFSFLLFWFQDLRMVVIWTFRMSCFLGFGSCTMVSGLCVLFGELWMLFVICLFQLFLFTGLW